MPKVPLSRVGLMGGTFDPIHYGHLFIAEEARVRCHLDRIIFFPNGEPPHAEGKQSDASAEQRLEMTELAIADNPYFWTSRIELDRPGKSYAYETVTSFQEQLGPEADLHFIIGGDSLCEILTWFRSEELLLKCRFIAASRPGYDLEAGRAALLPHQLERFDFLEVPGLHIASRGLRDRVAHGQTIRYLTPESVVRRIDELGLYHTEGSRSSK